MAKIPERTANVCVAPGFSEAIIETSTGRVAGVRGRPGLWRTPSSSTKMIVLGERRLLRLVAQHARHNNEARTAEPIGSRRVVAIPRIGEIRHRCARAA